MRVRACLAVVLAAWAASATAAKPAPAAKETPAAKEPAAGELAGLSVWVDDDVPTEGKGSNRYDDGVVESLRGRVSGALMALGARVVKKSTSKHDAVARLALLELERRSGILRDVDVGTLSLEVEGDGRLLAQTRRRFTGRDAIEQELGEALAELVKAPDLVAYARERARSRSPAAALDAAAATSGKGAKRVAVLEFRGPLGASVLSGVADEARGAAAESLRAKGVAVMTRESMAVVLQDMGKDVAACSDGECEVETGRMIGADLIVTGEVIQVDKVYVLIMKLHETAGGSLVATKQARGKDALEIMDAVKPATVALFR